MDQYAYVCFISFSRRFHYANAFKYKAIEVWTKLLPILILLSKGFISSCIVCGKYLWYVLLIIQIHDPVCKNHVLPVYPAFIES